MSIHKSGGESQCKDCPLEHDRRNYDKQITELYDKICLLEERLDPVIEVWAALSGMAKVFRWAGVLFKWIAIFLGVAALLKGLGVK